MSDSNDGFSDETVELLKQVGEKSASFEGEVDVEKIITFLARWYLEEPAADSDEELADPVAEKQEEIRDKILGR